MHDYQREFIEFMVRSDVLTFGDFETKSGRRTPYFVNTGRYRTGEQAARLGRYYADAIQSELSDERIDVLFGPAYKGIPLVIATSIALHEHYGREVAYSFNRKEAKDHGEGGSLVGHVPKDGDRVLYVEDVTTAGTSIRETMPILRATADVEVVGLVISVDRRERGQGERSALEEVGEEFGMRTFSIVTIDDVVEHMARRELDGAVPVDDEQLARIEAYRAEYGARA